MSFESEIKQLLQESVLDEADAAQLEMRAKQEGRSPLLLLYDSGVISEETLFQLQQNSMNSMNASDQAKTGVPPQDSEPMPRQSMPKNIAHYQLIDLLGKGGMGHVYRAFDTQLKRQVAIKLLKDDHPELTARFIREAHAQARVDHPNIASIYEVGEFEGQPYIAMQLIDGKQLLDIAVQMSTEQLILTMIMVCDAVHEAHRVGLVHRDLKPANIMVEQSESGAYMPYVLDFGLAFIDADHQLTMDGSLLGTPVYMAPEQARGDLAKLNRTTDVYALGASLYHLLGEQPPFLAESRLTLLQKIIDEEPPKLKSLSAEVPADLETIVLKCLAKEQQERYLTSRALADDLRRFLDGEPILARPTGWRYYLAKKLKKHRTLVTVSTLATVLLFFSLAWGAWQTSRKTQMTARLFEQVEAMDALSRFSHMSPAHDLRADLTKLENKMVLIRKEMASSGRMAKGPGSFALGRGHQQLGQHQLALEHYQQAWTAGYQESRVAYGLGLTYAALYWQALERLAIIEDGPAREKRRAEMQKQYRDPALEYMRLVDPSETDSPVFLAAHIQFLEGKHEAALSDLDQILRDRPWFYEVPMLKGDIYRDAAEVHFVAGRTHVAQEQIRLAMSAYEQAAKIAPSNELICRAQAETVVVMMRQNLFDDEGLDVLMDQGLAYVDRALSLLPEDGNSFLSASRLYRRLAKQQEILKVKDPLPLLKNAETMALKAADLHIPGVFEELTEIYTQWGSYLKLERIDPEPMVVKGLVAFDKIAEKNMRSYILAGRIHKLRASWQRRSGQLPCDAFSKASEAYEQALKVEPVNSLVHMNLAITLHQKSYYKECTGDEPRVLLEEMIQHLDEAERLRPDYWLHAFYQGLAYRRLAEQVNRELAILDDTYAAKAMTALNRAMSLNAEMKGSRQIIIHNEIGGILYLQGRKAIKFGQEPDEFFEKAVQRFNLALERSPNHRMLLTNLAWVYYQWGKDQVRQGKSGRAAFDQAEVLSKRVDPDGKDLEVLLCLASVDRIRAESAFLNNEDAQASLKAALKGLQKILEINPNHTEAHRSLGRLHTLWARSLFHKGHDPEAQFQAAKKSLDRALLLEPKLPVNLLASARWFLHRADWQQQQGQDAQELLTQGASLITQCLAIEPNSVEAAILKQIFATGKEEPGKLLSIYDAYPGYRYYWTLMGKDFQR